MTPVESWLSPEEIALAVEGAGLDQLATGVAKKFSEYFDLLQRWNEKLNLTAIRDPVEVLRRHFIECIFCAQRLPLGIRTLLDYGSGGGFPGIPIALCRPEIRVTLAESQTKKASFLREAVRSLGLSAEVYGGRVEAMKAELRYDAVSLRAVDKMESAILQAGSRLRQSGWLVVMTTRKSVFLPPEFRSTEVGIPGSSDRILVCATEEREKCST